MDQTVFLKRLDDAGIDTQKAIARFMGNTALFLKFVRRLPDVLRFREIRTALQQEDDEIFYMLVHTLKGTAANLSAENVAECVQAILVEYRTSGFKHMRKLKGLLREAEVESEKLSELLRRMDEALAD
ncbi:Hpt domain-containing protein [Candidatus Agathobaculum pullicola]|uniref:Hpt domain-containing protein n=1 Tax=Candidatus Agathobaculum pullicola TaxID=2838426 RepID=UPI003F8F751E